MALARGCFDFNAVRRAAILCSLMPSARPVMGFAGIASVAVGSLLASRLGPTKDSWIEGPRLVVTNLPLPFFMYAGSSFCCFHRFLRSLDSSSLVNTLLKPFSFSRKRRRAAPYTFKKSGFTSIPKNLPRTQSLRLHQLLIHLYPTFFPPPRNPSATRLNTSSTSLLVN